MKPKQTVLVDLGKLAKMYTGLGQVSFYYGKELASLKEPDLSFVFLTPPASSGLYGSGVGYEKLSLKRRYLPAFAPRYDLWHALHQDSAYFPGDKKTPYLLTIHDLNFIHEKSEAKAKIRLQRLQKKVNRAAGVVYLSNYTRDFAREHLTIGNIPERVIYNGVNTLNETSAQRPDFLPEGKFMFAMGVIKPKKNFHVLVDFLAEMPDYRLILAGDKSDAYALKISDSAKEAGISDRLILPGAVNESHKAYLYRNCEAFLFPSLAEGFGLPVIEALRFGKPVFTTGATSLAEIGGGYVYTWDNFSAKEMAQKYIQQKGQFSDKAKIKERIKYSEQFTWKSCVSQYLTLYRMLLKLR